MHANERTNEWANQGVMLPPGCDCCLLNGWWMSYPFHGNKLDSSHVYILMLWCHHPLLSSSFYHQSDLPHLFKTCFTAKNSIKLEFFSNSSTRVPDLLKLLVKWKFFFRVDKYYYFLSRAVNSHTNRASLNTNTLSHISIWDHPKSSNESSRCVPKLSLLFVQLFD